MAYSQSKLNEGGSSFSSRLRANQGDAQIRLLTIDCQKLTIQIRLPKLCNSYAEFLESYFEKVGIELGIS